MAPTICVREFYSGRNLMITGATGFMGKVLLEKLLYSIPEIGKIYIVMRSKKGKSINQRLEEMLRSPIFDRLKNERPNDIKKLVAIQGDVVFEDLGISSSDLEKLSEEVSVVFHFAATLRLEAPLKDAIVMNTVGTQRCLNIARRFKHLAVFVHLSTAFCYPDYKVLEEKFHSPPADPNDVMRLCDWLDDKQLALLTPSLLGQHPNSYTYSKRLAESLVNDAYPEMPVVIARPSIVCPSYKEPMPGWVDNLNGPVGVMLAAGKGVIRTMLCDGSLQAQVIPVDVAINAIIALGAIEGSKTSRSELIPIYNVNTGDQVPTTWGEVLEIAKVYARKYPLSWPLWYPNGAITTNPVSHEIKRLLTHMLPAYFIDFLLLICGQKRIMLRIQARINQGLELLQYFTMRQWLFPCPNYDAIEGKLHEEEREIYQTQDRTVDKEKYMHAAVEGGRIYCLKEDPSKLTLNRTYHNFSMNEDEKSQDTGASREKYMQAAMEGGRLYLLKEDPSDIGFNRTYHNFLFFLDLLLKVLFWCLMLSFLASWFQPVREVFALGEPIVKHVPFLGATVFNEQYNTNH